MAKTYRRSLLTFYLAEPPRKGDRGNDFRSLPQQHTIEEPLVDALVRDVRTRQSIMRSALEDDEDSHPLSFIGSMQMTDGVDALAASISGTIGFDLAEFRAQASVDDAFAYIRGKAETAGVFVLLIGNLGNHHTDVEVAAFRGFALADTLAPFVVVNDHDAHSAWSFTLIHELAHLWLGQTGISGPYDFAANWDGLPSLTRETIQHHTGASSPEEARERAAELSLAGVAERIEQPCLVITGRHDRLIPWADTKRIADEAPNGEWVLFDDGNHVCNNIPYKYRPLVADWMRAKLG